MNKTAQLKSKLPLTRRILSSIVLSRVFLIALILISGTFALGITSAQTAQPVIGLSISPTLSEVQVKPGERVTHAFNIKNEGDLDLIAVPLLLDFVPDGVTGAPIVLPNQSTFPYATLQNVDKSFGSSFYLEAGATDQLVVSIRVPEGAPLQDYYQTLVLQTNSAHADLRATGPQAGASIGVHMLIRISDQTKQDVTLSSNIQFESWTLPKIIDSFSPLTFRLFAENQGVTYTKVAGSVRVISMTQEILKLFPILPENVLAGSVRELRPALPDPDQQGAMLPGEFRYEPGFLLGMYTVQLRLGSEHKQEEIVREQTVLAIPISIIVTGIFILLIWIGVRRFILSKIIRTNHLTTTTKTIDDGEIVEMLRDEFSLDRKRGMKKK